MASGRAPAGVCASAPGVEKADALASDGVRLRRCGNDPHLRKRHRLYLAARRENPFQFLGIEHVGAIVVPLKSQSPRQNGTENCGRFDARNFSRIEKRQTP